MSKNNKVKIFKIILTIIVLILIIGIIAYLFPVMKNLSSLEGQVAFKQKVEDSGILGMLSLFGLQVAQIFLTNRNIIRNVLWWTMGNCIYYGICFYYINSNIFFS